MREPQSKDVLSISKASVPECSAEARLLSFSYRAAIEFARSALDLGKIVLLVEWQVVNPLPGGRIDIALDDWIGPVEDLVFVNGHIKQRGYVTSDIGQRRCCKEFRSHLRIRVFYAVHAD